MMNKGISKFLISTLSILLLVCPFSIYADDYTTQSGIIIGANTELVSEEIHTSPGSNEVSSFFVYKTTFELNDYYSGYLTLSINTGYNQFSRTVVVNGNSCSLTFHLKSTGTYGNTERPYLSNISYSVTSHNIQKQSKDYYLTYYQQTAYEYFYKRGLINFASDTLNSNGLPFESTAIRGTFTNIHDSNLYVDNYITVDGGTNIVFGFMVKQPYTLARPTIYYGNWRNGTVAYSNILYSSMGWDVYLMNFASSSEGAQFTFDISSWEGLDVTVIPVYLGPQNAMPDDIYTFFYNQSRTIPVNVTGNVQNNINVLTNGTQSSNESAADNNSAKDDLVSASDSLINQENSFNDSMNSSLQNIDTSSDLNAMGSKFASSANWVTVQFNRLTNSTPFGSVLSFTLLLGLALLLIGRWRHD